MAQTDNKQLLILTGAWFLFSYAVLWLLGGACTNFFSNLTTKCLASGSTAFLANIPLVSLLFPLGEWGSAMYFIAPIAGFVFAYGALRWYNEYFETEQATSPFILLGLIVLLIGGFYINVSWYYGEAATLNSSSQVKVGAQICFFEPDDAKCNQQVQLTNQELQVQAQKANATSIQQYIPIPYWSKLRESMFLVFMLGAMSGWVGLFGRKYLLKE